MYGEKFLLRLKLSNKVAASSKAKAEGLHFGKKSDRATIQKTTSTVKAELVDGALHYIQYLINEVLRQTGLSTDIIKRLAAFDPFIKFKEPMEVALRHFDLLYSSFCLRSWVTKANESICRDQYTQLLDHLRVCYGPDFDVTSTSQNLDWILTWARFPPDSRTPFVFVQVTLTVCHNPESQLP